MPFNQVVKVEKHIFMVPHGLGMHWLQLDELTTKKRRLWLQAEGVSMEIEHWVVKKDNSVSICDEVSQVNIAMNDPF